MEDTLSTGQHGLITAAESILVIIDVQDKLMPAIADEAGVIQNLIRLAKFSRIISLPTIVTEQRNLGRTVDRVAKELPGLDPVSKVHFNCFCSDEFKDRLLLTGRRTMLLAGVEAHICVAQTALEALPHFRTHVVSDAISSRTTENRNTALTRMMQAGCTISSTEMLIYELLRKAGTEEFRAALQLVK